jgi:hypothetical protein
MFPSNPNHESEYQLNINSNKGPVRGIASPRAVAPRREGTWRSVIRVRRVKHVACAETAEEIPKNARRSAALLWAALPVESATQKDIAS